MSRLPSENKCIEKKSLDISFYKGLFGCIMTGLTQEYFAPFILYLGGQARHIGIFNSSANFFSSLMQLFSAEIVEKFKSRQKMISLFVILQAVILFLIVVFILQNRQNYWVFIVLAVLFTGFGMVFNPAWMSFLSDLVDVEKRGDYFGWRSRNLGLATVGMMIVAGIILHRMEKINLFYGFALLFGLACLSRVLSWRMLHKMVEPPLSYRREDHFTFVQFFRRLKESNFAKFVLFVSLMNFSVNLAAPYFAVLMLRDLSFNYLIYTAVITAAPLILFLNVRRWGRHADVVGNLMIIRLTSRLIAVIPFLWILNQSPPYLVMVEMFSGFLWAGFNLCSVNFIYDAVTPSKRTRCIAYFNVVNGVALAIGALLGGFIIPHLPRLSGYPILALFLISSILRFMVSLVLPRMLKEVRHVKHVKNVDLLLSMIRLRPILGVQTNGSF